MFFNQMKLFFLFGVLILNCFVTFSQQADYIILSLGRVSCKSERIINDSNAKLIIEKGISILTVLADRFIDSTVSLVYSDCNNRYLTVGELAIILADRVEMMPYFPLTGIENCTMKFCDKNPNLIEYYFNTIHNRLTIDEFQRRYKAWLKSKNRRKGRWLPPGRPNND